MVIETKFSHRVEPMVKEKTYFPFLKHKPLLSSSFFCAMKGGIYVPQEQSSLLRFSVEESVWFQKGQEVEELISISLEPDIAIREHDQYVSIKGALQLAGEYKMGEFVEEDEHDSFPYSGARYVQDIETREDGVSELIHHFPVDITIPRNRVTNLEDVYVTVETFDYEFPENRCLKLVADITILGIRGEDAHDADGNFEEEVEDHEEAEQPFEPMYRSDQSVQTEYEADPSQDLSDIFLHPEEEVEEHEAYSTYTFEAKQDQEEAELSYREGGVKEKEQVQAERSEQKEERKNDNSLYLTKLFTREDEEEFSKLKMCIVQQGETVEEICERYDISVQQLIRVNHLDPDPTVYDGQILYIPVYVNH